MKKGGQQAEQWVETMSTYLSAKLDAGDTIKTKIVLLKERKLHLTKESIPFSFIQNHAESGDSTHIETDPKAPISPSAQRPHIGLVMLEAGLRLAMRLSSLV